MNYFAIGFVGLAAVVGLGVDYHQQSIKADLPLGKLSVNAYIDTYEARFLGAKAEMAAAEAEKQREENWRQGGIQYLPEAPDGWTRRSYSEGVNSAIQFPNTVFYEELAKNGGAQNMAEGMKAKKANERMLKADRTTYVYENGEESVMISVDAIRGSNGNSLHSMINASMGAFASMGGGAVQGYKVVGGVGLVEHPVDDNTIRNLMTANDKKLLKSQGFRRAHFRRLTGVIGFNQRVRLTVHANASTASTMEILNRVDWDGLNAMLKTPMALVGNDVVLPEEMDEREMARAMHGLRNKFKGLNAMAMDFKLSNLNEAALVLNVYSGGAYDLTGGAVPDLSMMIEGAYRKELRDLMAGRPSSNEYERIRSMMVERPIEERDQPKGEMSDELRRELMGYVETDEGSGAPYDRADIENKVRLKAEAMGVKGPALEMVVKSTMENLDMQHEQAGLKQADVQQAEAKQSTGGGIGSWFKGMMGGGGAAAPAAGGAPAYATGGEVKIRRVGEGKNGPKAGGCGAGQFCKATE